MFWSESAGLNRLEAKGLRTLQACWGLGSWGVMGVGTGLEAFGLHCCRGSGLRKIAGFSGGRLALLVE